MVHQMPIDFGALRMKFAGVKRVPIGDPENYQPNEVMGLIDMIEDIYRDRYNPNHYPSFDVLEIGTGRGVSTSVFANTCDNVITIDNLAEFPDSRKEIQGVLDRYPNVVFIEGDSCRIVKAMNDIKFDIVYIDANHNYDGVKEDIELWRGKVKKGGYLAGHDYDHYHIGVVQAVQEMLYGGGILHCYRDSSWMLRIL
jgi:hypothetical protein